MKQSEVFEAFDALMKLKRAREKARRDLARARTTLAETARAIPAAEARWKTVKSEYAKNGAKSKIALVDSLDLDVNRGGAK